jgi:limonene-1,2-epoxide hydrolase
MPWFPDFVSAVELARRQTRAAGQADPVAEYVVSLNRGDTRALETVWPVEVVVHDPRAGEVRGHRHLRTFLRESKVWLAERHARTETIASTLVGNRVVVELVAHLVGVGDGELAWPVAVVSESPDDRSVVFRSYFSRWAVSGNHHVRPPILEPSDDAHPADVVGRYHAALDEGDTEAILGTFAATGYFREPVGPTSTHRGTDELRSFFDECFGAGGGIGLQHCAVTDDGVRCALEYNCTRWGSHDLAPQAGLGVYERSPDGLLAAARIYDDVEPPFEKP